MQKLKFKINEVETYYKIINSGAILYCIYKFLVLLLTNN